MTRSILGSFAVALVVFVVNRPAPAYPVQKPRPNPGRVVGAIWEWTVTNKEGKELEQGTFRAYQNKIFKGATQIGTYTQAGRDHIKIHIFQGKLKGDIDARQILNKPITLRGDIMHADHGKAKIKIVLKAD